MDIIRLAPGHDAPEMEDRVRITKAGPEAWRWGGNVAYRRDVPAVVFNDCPDYYPTQDAAEIEALSWATTQGSETLYVEVDDA